VCDGWSTPVNDLIALGLQAEVLRRLNAFTTPADRTVYVVGHSRGGSLVSCTLLLLLLPAAVVMVVVCLYMFTAASFFALGHNAFPSPADRTVYVVGHSRGGSLVRKCSFHLSPVPTGL
jgi:alpha-beta hydrolase superfamily lysophospholipase